MKAAYSAHPALASKQLQRAEIADQKHHSSQNSSRRTSIFGKSSHSIPLKAAAVVAAHRPCCSSSTKNSTTQKAASAGAALATDATQPKLPDRTDAAVASAPPLEDGDGDDDDIVDSVDAGASVDEFDHVQKRFSRKCIQPLEQQNITSAVISTPCTRNYHCSQLEHKHFSCSATTASASAVAATAPSSYDGAAGGDYGASSGLSSADSSPSASTTTSPLSTPTRFVPHCCHQQKAAADAGSAPSIGGCSSTAAAHHQHPHHHHPHVHKVAGCKKLQKFDPRLGPSPYRQLLPIALCILSFATVFSILIVYMDTTEIRHQQFRLNMSRDYEMFGVPQDDPELIAFLREIQMKKYPMHFLKNRDAADQQSAPQQARLNFSEHPGELTPEMAHYVSGLVGGKLNGTFIQSLPGALGEMMTAPWLAGTLNWAGVIVEPEPRRYFALRKQNALHSKLQVVHACVSQNAHPKEVTIHNEEAEVRINSLMDEETSWFFSRLKCFPLYTIMLACNRVAYDLLSLGVHGHELEILQTLPFDKIRIEVISVHLPDDHDNVRSYVQTVTKFLKGKSYKLQKNFGRNYFYQRINSTNRTRKKDILFKKPIQQL